MKISVIINTLNSEAILDKVLECLEGFDEILVCDSGSTDNTLRIAERHGCRIVNFEPGTTMTMRNARHFALMNIRNPWALYIEPNELVTPALREYLYKFEEMHPDADGLFIPRKRHLLNHFFKSYYPDYRLRFFRHDKVNWIYENGQNPQVAGKTVSVDAAESDKALIFFSCRFTNTHDRYGRAMKLQSRYEKKSKVSLADLFVLPFESFVKMYLVNGAWRYGKEGFILSARAAGEVFEGLSAIHEQKRLKEFNDTNAPLGITIGNKIDKK